MKDKKYDEFDGRTLDEQIDFENKSLLAYTGGIEKECEDLLSQAFVEFPVGIDEDGMREFLESKVSHPLLVDICWKKLYGEPYDEIITQLTQIKNGSKKEREQ